MASRRGPDALELVIRFDYGRIVPWVRVGVDGALLAVGGPGRALPPDARSTRTAKA